MFKKQLRIYSIAVMTLLICSTNAYCQEVPIGHFIDADDLDSPGNTSTLGIGPNVSFVVFAEAASNRLPVDSLRLSIRVNADLPQVTDISGLGIFSEATASFTPPSLSEGDFVSEVFLSLPNSADLSDSAPVAEIFFDTTELSDGDTFNYGFSGEFFNDDEIFPTVSILTFVATIEAVPEPSSAGFLLALGTIAMMRRNRD